MNRLKPCPFCGNEVIDVQCGRWHYATCADCEADGPMGATESEAVEMWNERVKPSIPWRKVSEEPYPWGEDRQIVRIKMSEETGNRIELLTLKHWRDDFHEYTHWCYLDELKPEDAG